MSYKSDYECGTVDFGEDEDLVIDDAEEEDEDEEEYPLGRNDWQE